MQFREHILGGTAVRVYGLARTVPNA
jgi:hypothetical protein